MTYTNQVFTGFFEYKIVFSRIIEDKGRDGKDENPEDF
jgi:hypothetical protein